MSRARWIGGAELPSLKPVRSAAPLAAGPASRFEERGCSCLVSERSRKMRKRQTLTYFHFGSRLCWQVSYVPTAEVTTAYPATPSGEVP